MDVGRRGALLLRGIFGPGRNSPGVRGQPNCFALRFPARLDWRFRGFCCAVDVVPQAALCGRRGNIRKRRTGFLMASFDRTQFTEEPRKKKSPLRLAETGC